MLVAMVKTITSEANPLTKLKVGIVGTGNISGIYLQNGKRFDSMEVVACADLDVERAKAKAQERGLTNVGFILGDEKSPKLPENSTDLAFILDAYHPHAALL